MSKMKALAVLLLALLLASSVFAGGSGSVAVKLSGPGKVDNNTIKAGQKVFFDIYFTNDVSRNGFTLGFRFTSPDIKTVIHPADSGHGLNDLGDCKGYNGWQDKSIFDLAGVMCNEADWDGHLPDTMGFLAICFKNHYLPKPDTIKQLSIEMIVPTPGTLVVDSSFVPPSLTWLTVGEPEEPELMPKWFGPYTFKVVK